MSPEERRASLIEATLPLLLTHGPSLTTKQVAEAAGVAEGTIFRVFDSLNHLIDATTLEALSSRRLQAEIATITPGDTLASKTRAAVAMLAKRMGDIRSLLHVAHTRPASDGGACLRDELDARRLEIERWLLDLLEPHVDELAIAPEVFVDFLRTLALGHVITTHSTPLDVDSIADLALTGATRKAN